LRIAKVKKDHEGRYYCVAENEHGFGKNKTIDLKVFGKYNLPPIKYFVYHHIKDFFFPAWLHPLPEVLVPRDSSDSLDLRTHLRNSCRVSRKPHITLLIFFM
jgi:hypothetical protein